MSHDRSRAKGTPLRAGLHKEGPVPVTWGRKQQMSRGLLKKYGECFTAPRVRFWQFPVAESTTLRIGAALLAPVTTMRLVASKSAK